MFFSDPSKILSFAMKTGFSVFVLPTNLLTINRDKKPIKTAKTKTIDLTFPSTNLFQIQPEDGKIRVDQIREISELAKTKSSSKRFIILNNADTMNEAAQNAFLKLLEEPKDHHHFILFVNSLSSLLPTVLSRAQIFVLKTNLKSIDYDPTMLEHAKTLITARPDDLIRLATKLSDKKLHKNPRADALEITSIAIELLYRSYLETQNPKFLKKLEKLINLHQNLQNNGHVKLHIVADLC